MFDIDVTEVYPNLFIGNFAAATNKEFLLRMGITHILNSAEGTKRGQVNTGIAFYQDMPHIRYMGISLEDKPSTDISRYFNVASQFIDEALQSGGRILVHCLVGLSRSVTCVLAFLMISRGMPAIAAIDTVSMRRYIRPNNGFLEQLVYLDNELTAQYAYNTAQ